MCHYLSLAKEKAMQQSNKKSSKKLWYKRWWAIILTLFFGTPIAIAIVFGVIVGIEESSKSKESGQPKNSQHAKINYIQPEWKITNTETVGTKYIVATGYLINSTDKTGIADCNIEFYDRELNWASGKGFGGRELKPNERYDFTVQVEVANVGLISKQSIDCEDGVY